MRNARSRAEFLPGDGAVETGQTVFGPSRPSQHCSGLLIVFLEAIEAEVPAGKTVEVILGVP